MNKKNLKLKRRLELVRVTVRELTAKQLVKVEGGGEEPPWWTCTPNNTEWWD